MLTDADIAEILAVRRDRGQDAAFGVLDAKLRKRRGSPAKSAEIVGMALDIMAETLAA